jgi:hypothetical protein
MDQSGGASYRREWSASSAQRIMPERNPPILLVSQPFGPALSGCLLAHAHPCAADSTRTPATAPATAGMPHCLGDPASALGPWGRLTAPSNTAPTWQSDRGRANHHDKHPTSSRAEEAVAVRWRLTFLQEAAPPLQPASRAASSAPARTRLARLSFGIAMRQVPPPGPLHHLNMASY